MSTGRAILLVPLILLVPVETLILAALFPIVLIGGFSSAALMVIVSHIVIFIRCNERKKITVFSNPYIATFTISAIILSLISIEFIYPRILDNLSWMQVWR